MAELAVNNDSLVQGIKCIQDLRFNVGELFKKMSDGVKGPDDRDGKEKEFLADVHHTIVGVHKNLVEIEKIANELPDRCGPSLSLGNMGLLYQDPVQDRETLYNQLLNAYKWSDKLHDHSQVAASLQTANSLKRTASMSVNTLKRLRRPGPTIHAVPPHIVDTTLASLNHLFPNEMTVQLTRPMGSSAILKITLGQTLRAVMVLRSLIIEWVVVKGYAEDLHLDYRKPEAIWSSSRYKVFQKITDHANSAMLHFCAPTMPEIAVKSFMTWFKSYITLFNQPCARCGKILSENLPPTWRDFRTTTAYHEKCKQ